VEKLEETSVVTLDARPVAQTGANRPVLDGAVRGQLRDGGPDRVRAVFKSIDDELAVEDAPLGRQELLMQAATVAGYALCGAVLFELGSWMVLGL
jgi:hypothetical protein